MTPTNIFNKLSHDWTLYLSSVDNITLPEGTQTIVNDYLTYLQDEEDHLLQQYSGTEDYYNEMHHL